MVEFAPLELVESIAQEHAEEACRKRLHINGYAAPDLPQLVEGDLDLIRPLLGVLTSTAIDSTQSGALLIETLADPIGRFKNLRFGVTTSISGAHTAESIQQYRDRCLEIEAANGMTCRQLCEKLNSELVVDKDLIGRATRIHITVPLIPAATPVDEPVLPKKLLQSKFFLVANDPPPNRIIQYYTRFYGLHSEGAPSSAEALLALVSSLDDPFDIIGIAPPIEDANPFELCTMIRKSDHPPCKMLYIAPFWDEDGFAQAREVGFDAIIPKPMTRMRLLQVLSDLAGDELILTRSKTVLVAEDNSVNAMIAVFQLRKAGFEADIVPNGQQALEAVATGKYTAVLMDLNMPIMDGIEATRIIRQSDENYRDIPIIAYTAADELKDAVLAAGADHFLVKPVSLQDLQHALTQCAKKKPGFLQQRRS